MTTYWLLRVQSLGSLVKNGLESLAEAAPVRVEVEKQNVLGWRKGREGVVTSQAEERQGIQKVHFVDLNSPLRILFPPLHAKQETNKISI